MPLILNLVLFAISNLKFVFHLLPVCVPNPPFLSFSVYYSRPLTSVSLFLLRGAAHDGGATCKFDSPKLNIKACM